MGSTTIFYLYWVTSYAHSKVSLVPSILPYLPLSPLLASVSSTCLGLPCFSLSLMSVPIHPICLDPPRTVCWSINAEVNRAKDLGSVGQIALTTIPKIYICFSGHKPDVPIHPFCPNPPLGRCDVSFLNLPLTGVDWNRWGELGHRICQGHSVYPGLSPMSKVIQFVSIDPVWQ